MSTIGNRLPLQSFHRVEASKVFTFLFDGAPVTAIAGDTVASALYAQGRRVFSRSFKYHRPRGLLCCSGDCPNCMVDIDGQPNMRACRTPVQEGMHVRSQNAWPSLDRDIYRIIERFERLLPIGFYYKTLYQSPFLWRMAEPIIRNIAGLGRVSPDTPAQEYEHQYEQVDVLVVGGGPAGIKAATQAAHAGVKVMLVEREAELGGHLLWETKNYQHDGIMQAGHELAGRMRSAISAIPNLSILLRATAFGQYEGGLVAVLRGNMIIHVRTKSVIVAAGCHQFLPVFQNNDIPGIMLSRAALRLMNLFAVRPGTKAIIYTASNEGYEAALECSRHTIDVAAIIDPRSDVGDGAHIKEVRQAGIPIFTEMKVVEAFGSPCLREVKITSTVYQESVLQALKCDLLLVATSWQGNTALLFQGDCSATLDSEIGQVVPTRLAPGTFAAGEILGLRSLPDIIDSGVVAAQGALQSLQLGGSNWQQELDTLLSKARLNGKCASIIPAGQKKNFVCLCEDVTEKDLRQGVEEGFEEIETLKRYSTVSMGPCQGRMCSRNSTEICGLATGRHSGTVGTTTSRPPLCPVPLGALAGPEFHPVKRTSMHYQHAEATRNFMNMGVWKRPLLYTTIAEEYDAVRNHAGLIDVSTLGKLSVHGAHAPAMLDKIYTHWFSKLEVGRARYGVICDDSGTILDDGTVARLTDDHYYVTTSTGNIDFVEQWIKWWATGNDQCVHIVNLTSGIAAVNVAGPEARNILTKVTDADLSDNAFPYMACRESTVAEVQAILLRVGFVGETGWEIHFPAEYGEYIWNSLLEAGKEFGLKPFGVEAQRLLRLEKRHVIVGHDTDALSNPYDSDLKWVVKLDKQDYIGRHAHERLRTAPSKSKLVGFECLDGGQPEDGDAVIIDGQLAGRITSTRFSPYLKKHIGLAWLPAEHSRAGSQFNFKENQNLRPAAVVERPFYDPDGKRLK